MIFGSLHISTYYSYVCTN